MKQQIKTLIIATLVLGILFGNPYMLYSKGHLAGRIIVEGQRKLRNLIVYLEPMGSVNFPSEPVKHQVTQKGRKFKPNLLVINMGDTVQYLNDEDKNIDHNIFSLSKIRSFDLGLGERGTVLEQTFDNGGKLTYFCSVHKLMEGKLVVLPNRIFILLEEPGNFILPDVPSGKWKVNVVVLNRRYKAVPIEISVGNKPIKDLILKVVKKR